jgi:hypothetical protein
VLLDVLLHSILAGLTAGDGVLFALDADGVAPVLLLQVMRSWQLPCQM